MKQNVDKQASVCVQRPDFTRQKSFCPTEFLSLKIWKMVLSYKGILERDYEFRGHNRMPRKAMPHKRHAHGRNHKKKGTP